MINSFSDIAFHGLVAVGVSGLVVQTAFQFAPPAETGSFFRVHEITAERVGDTANLHIDREIFLPIEMSFAVRVMEYTPAGVKEFCRMEAAPFQYQPDAVLPDPVTLDWWTHGKCAILPDGRARKVTTWSPTKPGYAAVSYAVEIPGKE